MDRQKIEYYHGLLTQEYDKSNPKEVLMRAIAVEKLEKEIGSPFRNTKEFKAKMDKFFREKQNNGDDLKKARLQDEKTQAELAAELNVSKAFVSLMENNKKALVKKAIEYIRDSRRKKKGIKSFYAFTVKMPLGIAPKGSKWNRIQTEQKLTKNQGSGTIPLKLRFCTNSSGES